MKGNGKKKTAIIIFVVIVLAISAVLAAVCWPREDSTQDAQDSTASSATFQTNAAASPTPTPSTTQTYQTPVQSGGILSAKEFIENALAGKYRVGDEVEVRAVLTKHGGRPGTIPGFRPDTEKKVMVTFYEFGPEVGGYCIFFTVAALTGEDSSLAEAEEGCVCLLRGTYAEYSAYYSPVFVNGKQYYEVKGFFLKSLGFELL